MATKNPTRLTRLQKGFLKVFGQYDWVYGKSATARINRGAAQAGDSIFGLANALNVFQSYAQLSHDRRIRYADYDAMDDTSPEIAGALSLYAQEVTAEDYHRRRVVWVESSDKKLALEMNHFLETQNMEERAWGTCRNLAKYGDAFWLNIFMTPKNAVDEKALLKQLRWLHPSRVDRVEDIALKGFLCPDLQGVIDPGNDEGLYRPWDLVHGRIMAYDSEDVYGRSMIEEIRKIWKMLQILETMVALAHVQRAIDRHIFYIDTTNLSDEEAMELVKKYKTWLRKKDYFDPTNNEFTADFNPVTIQEDLFWPTREGDNSRVDTLVGKPPPQGLIDDLEYFRNKMMSGMGVPKEYLDGEGGGGAFDSKASLVLQDIKFARKMMRLQRSFRRQVRQSCQIYWFARHREVRKDFCIKMGSLSLVSDIMNEDRWMKKADVINQLAPLADIMGWDQGTWAEFIGEDILGKELPRQLLDGLIAPAEAEEHQIGAEPPSFNELSLAAERFREISPGLVKDVERAIKQRLGAETDPEGDAAYADQPDGEQAPRPDDAKMRKRPIMPGMGVGVSANQTTRGLTMGGYSEWDRVSDEGILDELEQDFSKIKMKITEEFPELRPMVDKLKPKK